MICDTTRGLLPQSYKIKENKDIAGIGKSHFLQVGYFKGIKEKKDILPEKNKNKKHALVHSINCTHGAFLM